MLPIDMTGADLFAVRVSGTSMDGGSTPIRDGDWAVMRLARAAAASALADRIVLVQVPSEAVGHQYQIKRLRRKDDRWLLTSDNPAGPTIEPREDMVVIAKLERTVPPDALAPPIGTTIDAGKVGTTFGFDIAREESARHAGHLFIFIDRPGILEAPDELRYAPTPQRPAETAYVLAKRTEADWKYLGVARRTDDDTHWRIPEVDYTTWRTWGTGRRVSKQLPEGALSRAELAAQSLLSLPDTDRWLTRSNGTRARILGPAPRGGLRIDGGQSGFTERTISLQDLAWVILADDDVTTHGGILDEQRINRLRYLEGTPKSATRWIDTGWALAAWQLAKPHVGDPIALQLHRADGTPISATFRVERLGDIFTIVLESRGGTRGSPAERNSDYAEGLELLLERLGDARVQITDALVDSRETAALPEEQRRLNLDGSMYPIVVTDAAALRKKMSAAQPKIGRSPGARGGGNRNRRLRLFLEVGDPKASISDLATHLQRGIIRQR